MPMLKTLSSSKKHRTCADICEYLMLDEDTGEVRAVDYQLQNLPFADLMWGEQMDNDREIFALRQTQNRSTRNYYHFILSPDPKDNITAEDCMDYAREWVAENFPEENFQSAIVIHDDNNQRTADCGEGIKHAHIIVNPVELEFRHRLQIAKGAKRRKQIELGELGPEYVHEDILTDSAQYLASKRGWNFFDNDDRSYKKNQRANAILKESLGLITRKLVCNLTQDQAAALSEAFESAGVEAELEMRNGACTFTFPTEQIAPAWEALDGFIRSHDAAAMRESLGGERTLGVASVPFDEHADLLARALGRAGIAFTSRQREAHAELSFSPLDSAGVKDVCQQLVDAGELDPRRLIDSQAAFAPIILPATIRNAFQNYDEAFTPPPPTSQTEHLTSAEVSMRLRGSYSWKDSLRTKIEAAAKRSQTEDEMKHRLRTAHIKVSEWKGGFIYTDESGHVIRDALLGAAYTRKAMMQMYMTVSWVTEDEERRKKSMREGTLRSYRLIVREDSRKKEVQHELKLINELETIFVRENIHSWDDLDRCEEEIKALGVELRIELNKIGAELDRARALTDAAVDMRYYKEFADEYANLQQRDLAAARDYYKSFFMEIDGYAHALRAIEEEYGIVPSRLDAALAQANEVSQKYLDTQAAFDGFARRLMDIRTARDRARWVHSEVERRAALERIDRGDMTPALRDIVAGEHRRPKPFYRKDRAPYWTLNMTADTYKRNAERNRAARANFRRAEPAKFSEVPAYFNREEQMKRSLIYEQAVKRQNRSSHQHAEGRQQDKAKGTRSRAEER